MDDVAYGSDRPYYSYGTLLEIVFSLELWVRMQIHYPPPRAGLCPGLPLFFFGTTVLHLD